ncbi:hypothetical protein Tco_0942926 [Tanacetum coccineum]
MLFIMILGAGSKIRPPIVCTGEFGKFTSRDGESLESYYSRFYRLMNELVRNQLPELRLSSYHKLYDILKQHQNEVNVDTTERLARPATVMRMDEMSKEKEIDKLMALISLSYDNQSGNYVAGARENVGTLVEQKLDSVFNVQEYGQECIQGNVRNRNENAAWKDDTDDESDDQELEAHYMYMAQLQEVTPDPVDNSGPIFDDEPTHKISKVKDSYHTNVSVDFQNRSTAQILPQNKLPIVRNTNVIAPGRTRQPMAVPVSTTEPKHNVNKSVATSSKKTVATDSTVKKSRNITRMLYAQVSKTCSCSSEIILFIVDSGCSKNMTGNLSFYIILWRNSGTVKFGNESIASFLVMEICSSCFSDVLPATSVICKGNVLLTSSRFGHRFVFQYSSRFNISQSNLLNWLKQHRSQAWFMASSSISFNFGHHQLAFKDLYCEWPSKLNNSSRSSVFFL